MFAAYLTNALVWIFGNEGTFEIPIGFSESMACVLSSRLLLNVRDVHRALQDADAEAGPNAHPLHPLSGRPEGARRGGPMHIRTVIETVTVRDGDGDGDEDADDKAPRIGTPESTISMLARQGQDQSGFAQARRAGAPPSVRRQLSDGQAFQLRSMKAK